MGMQNNAEEIWKKVEIWLQFMDKFSYIVYLKT